MELDFVESRDKNEVLSTMWDWQGADESQMIRNRHHWKIADEDLSQWQVYGTLWAPGKVEWYLNGQLIQAQYWDGEKANDPKMIPVTADGQDYPLDKAFHVFDQEKEFDVILGTGTGRPFDVDYVRIWQAEDPSKPLNLDTKAALGDAGMPALIGDSGALIGDSGRNVLIGGDGADTFAFIGAPHNGSIDLIADFSEEDRIALSEEVFGQLQGGWFAAQGEAATADTRILQAGDTLFYDADGSGGAYQAQTLAKLENAAVSETQHFAVL